MWGRAPTHALSVWETIKKGGEYREGGLSLEPKFTLPFPHSFVSYNSYTKGGIYTRAPRKGGVCVRPLARSRLKPDGARRRVPVVRQQKSSEEQVSSLSEFSLLFPHLPDGNYPSGNRKRPDTQRSPSSKCVSLVPCRCGETSERSARVIVNRISTLTSIPTKSKSINIAF